MPSGTYAAIARRREEQGMVDQCVVLRSVTGGDPDPDTGKRAAHDEIVYAGPCEYVAANTQVRTVESIGRVLALQGAVLKLPIDAPGAADVRNNMTAIVRVGGLDPAVPIVEAKISGDHTQTLAVSRRFPVEVTTRG
jgi:hypothetical protein